MWEPGCCLDNHFAEQGIGPGKPGAAEVGRIIGAERLVHEAGAGMSGFESRNDMGNFGL